MKTHYIQIRLYFIVLLTTSSVLTHPAIADPIYHPSGPKLTFGGMTHRQAVSDMGNPAHPASIPYQEGDNSIYGGGLSFGAGIEYDGNDNLFKLIDKVANGGSTVSGGDDGSGESGEDGESTIPILPPLDGDLLDPAVKQELESLVEEIAAAGALVALALANVNARAFASADLPILISKNSLEGTWTFNANTTIITNLRGLSDPINFDLDVAKKNLLEAYNNSNTAKTYDLTGGASVTINPVGATKFRFNNDSAVITKAAHVTEISIGYSRKIWHKNNNNVYIGVKPKYINAGLSNTPIQITNIKKTKDIFDELQKKDFKYDQGFSLDLGASWNNKHFQFGATLTNINEPSFRYPAANLSSFTKLSIINRIRDNDGYNVERQLKFDGGFVTSNGAWGINLGFDANAVPDPMGDDFQWLSLGAGFASDNWWLPGGRLGIQKNMAGSELTYLTAGISFFNFFNLDLATTTDTIKINGQTVPRGAIANVSFHVLF